MIDTAAFFLVLDDFDHEIDHMEPSTLAVNGKVSAVLQAHFKRLSLFPNTFSRTLGRTQTKHCHCKHIFTQSGVTGPVSLKHYLYLQILLHGKGNDRWYDKSICVVVSKNGRIGCNVEHAWYDDYLMSF